MMKMTIFGWKLSTVVGFVCCGVLLPVFLIWRVETGGNPDRTLAFFWGGWVAGAFSKLLYELVRARGAFRTLTFDKKRSRHNPWLVPLLALCALLSWFTNSGEPWSWVYLLMPFAPVAGSLQAPRPQATGRS